MGKRNTRETLRRVEGHFLGDQAPPREPVPTPAPERQRRKQSFNLFTPDPDASPLERALGPGCLLSLVIVALMVIGFKRIGALPPPALAILAVVVFAFVLFLLLRMRPVRIDGNDPPTRRR